MTTKALALIANPPEPPRVSPVTVGELAADDVLVRTSLSGFSTGTDRWVMTGRFQWGGFTFPLVPGYQMTGVVERVGSAVNSLRIGQRVVAIHARRAEGLVSAWGCHASLVVSPETNVFDATGVPEISAAFVVSAQVGYNAASRVAAEPGDTVWVIGDGIIGASAALAAAARGFNVVVHGRHDARLAPLSILNIGTLNTRGARAADRQQTSPIAVIDTVQNDEAFASYIDTLEPRRGQIVYSGHSPDGIRHWGDMAALQQRELRVDFVSGWTEGRLLSTLEAMRTGALVLDPFVTEIARDRGEAERLATTVSEGQLVAIAAVIDWRLLS